MYRSTITPCTATHPTRMADDHARTTIRLGEVGGFLGGRPLAARLRQQITEQAAYHVVVVDMEGIEAMSPSFADELFGKLDSSLWNSGRVSLIHVRKQLAPMVTVMIQRRANDS